jgi:uncharacterized integral membrane protein
MDKKLLTALLLLGLVVVIIIMTSGSAHVNLLFDKVQMRASFAYLLFTALGIVIGVMLK